MGNTDTKCNTNNEAGGDYNSSDFEGDSRSKVERVYINTTTQQPPQRGVLRPHFQALGTFAIRYKHRVVFYTDGIEVIDHARRTDR